MTPRSVGTTSATSASTRPPGPRIADTITTRTSTPVRFIRTNPRLVRPAVTGDRSARSDVAGRGTARHGAASRGGGRSVDRLELTGDGAMSIGLVRQALQPGAARCRVGVAEPSSPDPVTGPRGVKSAFDQARRKRALPTCRRGLRRARPSHISSHNQGNTTQHEALQGGRSSIWNKRCGDAALPGGHLRTLCKALYPGSNPGAASNRMTCWPAGQTIVSVWAGPPPPAPWSSGRRGAARRGSGPRTSRRPG